MPPSKRDSHYDIEEPQDYVEPRPFRWGRYLMLAFLLVMVVVILGHWWWSNRAERQLLAQMDEYRKLGEPTEFEDFNDTDIPDSQNAAEDLRAAARAIVLEGDDRKAFDQIERGLPLRDKEVALFRKVMEESAEAFKHVQTAKAKPAVSWKLRFQSPMIALLLPDLNSQKDLANLLAAAALLAHHEGDDATAILRIEDLHFVAAALQKQPILVSHLVSNGVRALAADTLRHIAPDFQIAGSNSATGRPADRKRVQELIADLLDDAPVRAGFRRALQGERLAQKDSTMLLGRGNAQLLGTQMGPNAVAIPAALIAGALRPIIFEDGTMMVRYTTAVAEAARQETLPAARATLPPFPMEQKTSILHLNARLFMPALDAVLERQYRTIMDRRATGLILAIRLYAADHGGKLPERLDDLVPTYLTKLPVDPFSRNSEPLKYLNRQDPIVYSVNTNGTDEGGSKLDSRGRPIPNNTWNAVDQVFHLTRQPRAPEPPPDPDLPPDLIEPIPLLPDATSVPAAPAPQ